MDWTRFHALGAEGRLTFSNGDKATGEGYEEEGRVWYRAIAKDGKEYETEEMPAERLPIVIVQHSDGRQWIEAKH
jgi:hypothetical protein